MRVLQSLVSVTRAASIAFLALSGGAAVARDLIHQMPPLSSERLDDIIHQFPPLRPVPQPRARAPEPPPEAYDAPTLAEAPRKPYDGPTLEELGVPPPEPPADAGEKFAEAVSHVSDLEVLPAAGSSPLAETYARKPESGALSGEALKSAIEFLRAKVDLAHFLWPAQPTPPVPDAQPTPAVPDAPPPPAPPEGGDDAPAFSLLDLALLGVALAVLLYFGITRRDRLLALVARIRGARSQTLGPDDGQDPEGETLKARIGKITARFRRQQEEEPLPPVDLSRLARVARKSPSEIAGARGDVLPPDQAVAAAEAPAMAAAPIPGEAAGAGMTDDLVLVEPGDAAAASAAINAARTQREGSP